MRAVVVLEYEDDDGRIHRSVPIHPGSPQSDLDLASDFGATALCLYGGLLVKDMIELDDGMLIEADAR